MMDAWSTREHEVGDTSRMGFVTSDPVLFVNDVCPGCHSCLIRHSATWRTMIPVWNMFESFARVFWAHHSKSWMNEPYREAIAGRPEKYRGLLKGDSDTGWMATDILAGLDGSDYYTGEKAPVQASTSTVTSMMDLA